MAVSDNFSTNHETSISIKSDMIRAVQAKINAAVLALLNIWLILIKIRLYYF